MDIILVGIYTTKAMLECTEPVHGFSDKKKTVAVHCSVTFCGSDYIDRSAEKVTPADRKSHRMKFSLKKKISHKRNLISLRVII